jgi:phosphatidylglycerophosphate synthase
MLDAKLRQVIDPPMTAVAGLLTRAPITANQVTILGFVVGLTTIPLLATQHYLLAALAILINRLFDGLDGAIARQRGISDAGGYLDIVLDFIFYSAVVFGFALGHPSQAVYASFLIFSFIGTGASFLAFAVFAAKHKLSTQARGKKSIYYLGGLSEGFETIVALLLICIAPQWFWLTASVFGVMCWITTLFRVLSSFQLLQSIQRNSTD